MMLKDIRKENDIQKLDPREYDALAREIREFLIEHISKTGGHLASNLGVVELTMALHLSFHLPSDKMIWDVGHQAYTHKLLTGRMDEFDSLRQLGGISGFPKHRESHCDAFDTGHSSTSISAGLGIARARDLCGEDFHVVSIIGDGSLTGGMAYEALNNAAEIKSNFIIVLNDNGMSISRNVGSMSHYLHKLRTAKSYISLKGQVSRTLNRIPEVGDRLAVHIHRTKNGIKQMLIPGMFFEEMGITYLGPVDGHKIPQLLQAFEDAKQVDGPVLVHVLTKKGKGYLPAEKNPELFHGVGPFDRTTGRMSSGGKPSYTKVFSDSMMELGRKDPGIVAVTAAMADGTGLADFGKAFPKRFFDVGIAEEHAVTFAAGMASQGLKPVVAVYSSFLQRSYDQIIHDVCIQQLPVVFAVDRAGLVGNDGETHQGIFDLSFLSTIPDLVVMAPKNGPELKQMMSFAVDCRHPAAVRYPRGKACQSMTEFQEPIVFGKGEVLRRGSQVALLAVGSMVETALLASEKLAERGLDCTVVNMRFVKPFDRDLIRKLVPGHQLLVTLEENVRSGGFGEHVAAFLEQERAEIHQEIIALPDCYIEQGTPDQLKQKLSMDPEGVTETIRRIWQQISEG